VLASSFASSLAALLAVAVVLAVGTLAGTLVAVATAVVPVFRALPAARYIQLHQLLDPGFDPLMPWISRLAMLASVALVVLAPHPAARFAWGAGLLLTGLVAVVSEVRNVSINRRVLSWDPQSPPADWALLRARWARGHQLRTCFAVAAFLADIGAVLLT
jgi:hypothetical protein